MEKKYLVVEIDTDKINSRDIATLITGRYDAIYGSEYYFTHMFDTEQDAEDFISKQEYGMYTILKIYK